MRLLSPLVFPVKANLAIRKQIQDSVPEMVRGMVFFTVCNNPVIGQVYLPLVDI